MTRFHVPITVILLLFSTSVIAESKSIADTSTTDSQKNKNIGKWLIAPSLTNSPKLGLSGGGSVNYIGKLDDKSPVSILGMSATYSNTKSSTALLYNRTFWDNNTKRVQAVVAQAQANNDYDNYLGQGFASVDTNFSVYYARYQQRISASHWFIGGSYIYSNISPQAMNSNTELIFSEFDISESYNSGLALNITFDSRDSVMNPKSGQYLEFALTLYDEAFGGDNDYWSFNTQYSYFQPIGANFILAYNTSLLSTPDAPKPSQASLRRYRGYTPGENTADNTFVAQLEARYAINEHWELAAFSGLASIFDAEHDIGKTEHWYPMGGIGTRYILDIKSKTMVRLDFAVGKSGNHGLYLKLGQPF